MDLNALRVFVAVVETNTFASAARTTGIPKSTVSRRIDELEADLGVRLIQRNTRRNELTDAGRSFYERARSILDQVADAVANVAQHQREPQGKLRFTASVLMAETYLSGWVSEYLDLNPLVELDMFLTPQNLDLLADGFDLALRVSPLEPSSYIVRRLADSPSYLCASPKYLELHPAPQTIDDLHEHRTILFSTDRTRPAWRLESAQGDLVTVHTQGRMTVNSHPVAFRACLHGLGLAEIPALVCCDALRSGELIRVLPEWSNTSRRLHAIYPSRNHLNATVRSFLDFLADRLAPPPWAMDE